MNNAAAVLMGRTKLSIGDISALSGISRPTVTKLLHGHAVQPAKRIAVVETLKSIREALLLGQLPVERVTRESPEARIERIRQAMQIEAPLPSAEEAETPD